MNTSPTVRLVGLALLVTLSTGVISALEPQGALAQSRPEICKDAQNISEQIAKNVNEARGRVDALEARVNLLLTDTDYSEEGIREEIKSLQREANGVNQQINQARAVNNRLKACGNDPPGFDAPLDTLTQRLVAVQEGIKQARINLKAEKGRNKESGKRNTRGKSTD